MSHWYKPVFAAVYDPIMARIEAGKLSDWRRAFLSGLSGQVLEIGSGTGVNFPFYPEGVQLIASDPSGPMIHRARRKAPKDKNIRFIQAGIGDRALDESIREGSLDAIVSTLVLCSVPEPNAAIDRFWKWLKPGGKVILIEHIHATKPVNQRLQHWVNPIWSAVADGCNLTRSTDAYFKESPFTCIEEHYDILAVRWYRAIYQKGPA